MSCSQKLKKMHLAKKGQVEMETVLALVFSLAVLLMVMVQTQQHQQEVSSLETTAKEKNQCSLIASIVSLMNSNQSKDSIIIDTQVATTISSNTVLVQNHYCNFTGRSQNTTLLAGKVKIHKQNGVVVLENA